MTDLATISDELATLVETVAPVVVQVLGGRRPASGVVHNADTVVTSARAIGREEGLKIRLAGSDDAIEADLAGWDPATGLAVLRSRSSLGATMPTASDKEPRPGELAIAIARSWSNAITSSAGLVAVVGGPLRTGRRRQIARVFRITAPMHDGFAGGGVFDASGRLAGIATASVIRGFGVAIPTSIAWAAITTVLTTGTPRRGYVGLAVQRVELPASQRVGGHTHALVVVGITPSGPAENAGVMVGDLLLELEGRPVEEADDLLELLSTHQSGQTVALRTLRGNSEHAVNVRLAERPKS